ncbi:hypothetical protein Desca_1598 [Desulfotomaculum nigrificans CO-1-SRB]|uniref:Uncharacterized protein n=1 Tax=Desulfotomaculum nigrificans (strain DSM 14880 / VKM B-2319 / CO-1-SRB) TaxID=868595 RepID=F6B726_DESCC|nr:hypothetical protein Desca_1598 [Desulfotomaculum nigrificans CO-1-SRB]
MAKEKRTSKAVEELEQLNSDCCPSSDCADSCSSVSDGCGRLSSDCQ